MKELLNDILLNPYKNYIYSYPHKKAYRDFDKSIGLKTLWEKANPDKLILYIHIPFCMNKCGYCNLLSSTNYDQSRIRKYVDKLVEEIKSVDEFLDINRTEDMFSSVIFGGGTPTILKEWDIRKILDALSDTLNIDFNRVFFSTETSPRTITKNKLDMLKDYGIDRISIGVQSFKEQELKNIFRLEPVGEIERSLDMIFKENIAIRNIDLIYGIPGQTLKALEDSLLKAVQYRPEEMYIYPIYIREKTALYLKSQRDIDMMTKMYKMVKAFLEGNNYTQTSMRNFIRNDMEVELFPEYSCQENNMIGLGCGARSYISNVHYSKKYAVSQKNINRIIDDYINEENFKYASYGYILNGDEQKRRYVQKSILKVTGLDIDDYICRFEISPSEDFKEISFLIKNGFLENRGNRLCPTEKGLMYSDAIGDLFISDEVRYRVKNFKEW